MANPDGIRGGFALELRLRPVLDPQSFHPFKLAGIVCYQDQIFGAGMRGNQQVIGADKYPLLFQIGPDPAIFPGCFGAKGNDRYTA